MPILLDTGALIALANRKDRWHAPMLTLLEGTRDTLLVPVTVLPETCYLLGRILGPDAEAAALDDVANGRFDLAPFTAEDVVRTQQILRRYRDLRLGFVDASVVALAERLGIACIATTDRRDFSVIRPAHCERFELLP